MKRRLMIAFGVIIGISVLVFSLFYSNSSQNDPTLTENQIRSLVSDQYPGEITELDLKKDGNQLIYEALVTNKEATYNIKLDGHSGNILDIIKKVVAVKDDDKDDKEKPKSEKKEELVVSKNEEPKTVAKSEKKVQPEQKNEVESKQDKPKVENNQTESKKEPPKEAAKKEDKKPVQKKQEPNKTEKKTVLSVAEVSKIALKHFSGEIDEIELDNENGRLIYEVEIERGEQEAELKIDAYTGELIVIEIEED